ncbi:hypothetical protein D3C86_2149350 [compost metagenome]
MVLARQIPRSHLIERVEVELLFERPLLGNHLLLQLVELLGEYLVVVLEPVGGKCAEGVRVDVLYFQLQVQ